MFDAVVGAVAVVLIDVIDAFECVVLHVFVLFCVFDSFQCV